jgi:5-methyltetrahydrofolate--homocysteine methyltransferase
MALENGLSAAIMNPYSKEMMRAYYSYNALSGNDENCASYISAAESFGSIADTAISAVENNALTDQSSELGSAIAKGFRDKAGEVTAQMILERDPLDIVNKEIIPALNTVGKGFEEKRIYLPQLLMSAEAARSAFEVIKKHMSEKGGRPSDKGRVIIATVKGDIHDIGKNIVKLLLENYGFAVTDMGKDVPPQNIVGKAVELRAPIVGLSALMTTTVPAMEETIKLLRKDAPWCKIVVGGAVLTEEYAKRIGADYYASDAMETVRYAEHVCSKNKQEI